MSPDRPAAVVVLAAGEGTRMKSSIPKVLHAVGGRTLVHHAVAAAEQLEPDHLVVVVGHGRDQVAAHLAEVTPKATTVVQQEQLGTGHAVGCALADLPQLTGTVVVTYGDVPLLSADTLRDLLDAHAAGDDAVTVLTAVVDDPTGYGRIVRGADGSVERIVEQKDATEAELRDPRDQLRRLRVRRRRPARRLGAPGHRQRPGRALPHRRPGRTRGSPAAGWAPSSSRTPGRSRASTTGSSSPRSTASSTGARSSTGCGPAPPWSTPPRPGSTPT